MCVVQSRCFRFFTPSVIHPLEQCNIVCKGILDICILCVTLRSQQQVHVVHMFCDIQCVQFYFYVFSLEYTSLNIGSTRNKINSFFPDNCRWFSCPNVNCDKMYTTSGSLNRHVRFQCGKKKPTCQCLYCEKQFSLPFNLKRHIKNIHPSRADRV